MKRAEFDVATQFRFIDEQVLPDAVGPDGRPLRVKRYEQAGTGAVFQVSDAANKWRRTGEGDATDGSYGGWHTFSLR